MRWVRRTHGWFGLWGAILGLMMGLSGIWLNHRDVMKLDFPTSGRSMPSSSCPIRAGDDRRHGGMAAAGVESRPAGEQHAGRALPAGGVDGKGRGAGRRGPAADAARALDADFRGTNKVVQVEYWVGNKSVGVRTTENGFVATLTNLHKGIGMPVPWILLIDTLAGSLIFLSISGAILWWETHRRRRPASRSSACRWRSRWRSPCRRCSRETIVSRRDLFGHPASA